MKMFFFEKKNQETFDSFAVYGCNISQVKEQRFFGSFFQKRTCFLATTAMALAAITTQAAAQRPTGGQVVAGQASIGGNATTTQIDQASQNAAINWQSYNVGNGQTVQYVQPNARAVTLNTVLSANPSQIAGKILANGQIVIVNQSGVVFQKGSQVDTAGLVVSSAGITTQDFMAGRMVFRKPGAPGAVISNAGNITIRQAGLAALVAPQVVNAGTITAALGRVILGGATTQTLDLYGDGLVSLNITGQVTQVSLGGKMVPALITNSGTILAPGGTVVLSAAAADGVVTNLVTAGGKIAAPTQGGGQGRVLVQGIGGGVTIDGQVSAAGAGAGQRGGQVVVNATGNVAVAAGATIDASGDSGGGVVAIGTTAERALGGASLRSTLTARNVTLTQGASVSANALRRGKGGHVAVLSEGMTNQQSSVSARGGASGGNGGWIEISGGVVQFGGLIDGSAPHGAPGSILIDPANIDLGTPTASPGPTTTVIPQAQFGKFIGNVILKADGEITVVSPVQTGSRATSLELEGNLGIFIDAKLTASNIPVGLLSGQGPIVEASGGDIIASGISAQAGGRIALPFQTVSTTVDSLSPSSLSSSYSGIAASLNADGVLVTRPATQADSVPLAGLLASGDITISVSGSSGSGNSLAPNSIILDSGITGSNIALSTSGSVAGYAGNAITQASGANMSAVGTAIFNQKGSLVLAGTINLATSAGGISLGGGASTAAPTATGLAAGEIILATKAGDIVELSTGSLSTGTLAGSAGGSGKPTSPPSGNANFAISAGNTINTLTNFTASGNFALEDDVTLVIGGVAATNGSLSVVGPSGNVSNPGILIIAGAVQGATGVSLSNALGIAELTGASVKAGGAVTLTTLNGGIVQQSGATIEGDAPSSAGTALAMSAGGSTAFDTYLPTLGLGTIRGITFSGGLQAGAAANGRYSGLANLYAGNGNIAELGGSGGVSPYLKAGTLTGQALGSAAGTGNADFTGGPGNTLAVLGDFTAQGNVALLDATGLTVTGPLSAGGDISLGTGSAGILVVAGSITATSTATGEGLITLSGTQGILETGAGQVSASNVLSLTSTNGAIVQEQGGMLAVTAAGSLSLSAGGQTNFSTVPGLGTLATIAGIALAGHVSVDGTNPTAGTASLHASAGDITEVLGGTASGVLDAATLSLSASGAIALATASSAGAGNQIGTLQSASAGAGFGLADGASLTIAGAVSAGLSATAPSTLSLIAPSIDITTGSLAVVPPTGTAPGAISLVADQFAFAGNISTPGGIVALDLLGVSGNTTFSAGGALSTLSPQNLAHIQTNGGTLALGSVDGTVASPNNVGASWTVGEGGDVALLSIAGALDLQRSGIASALGLFANGSIESPSGISVTSLYGAAENGTATLLGSNAVATLGVTTQSGILAGFSVQSAQAPGATPAFTFTDAQTLLVLGPVAAPEGAVDITVTNGGLNLGTFANVASGNISGTDILLIAQGPIVQNAGTLDASGASAGAPPTYGTLVLDSSAGSIALNGVLQAGAIPVGRNVASASGAILLFAGSGDITQTGASSLNAGTLAAQASGNIALTGNNAIAAIGPLSSVSAALSLTGLVAGGSTGADFTDQASLTILDGASISALGAIGSGNGVRIEVTSGGLRVGTENGATIGSSADAVLFAIGPVTQTGGHITATGAVLIDSASGSIAVGGSVSGADVLLAAGGGDISESGAIAAGTLAAAAAGNIRLAGANLVATIGSLSIVQPGTENALTLYGLSAQGASGIAFADNASLTVGADTGTHAVIDAASVGATIALIEQFAQGATYGSLAIGTAGGASILAGGGISLQSTGDLTFAAGSIVSRNAGIMLAATHGAFTSAGNASAAGNIAITAGGDVGQTAGLLSGLNTVSISAGGNIAEANAAILRGGVLQLSAAGDITLGSVQAGTLAAAAGGNFSAQGTIGAVAAVGSLGGISASTGSIQLTDNGPLAILPGATVMADGAQGAISISATSMSMDFATVAASGGVALSTGAGFAQAGGSINSALGDLAVSAQSIGIGQGAVDHAGATLSLASALSTTFSGKSLTGGQEVSLAAGGALTLSAGTITAGASTAGTFGGALVLVAGPEGVTGNGVVLQAGSLAAATTGSLALGNANNAVFEIGGIGLQASGDIMLADSQSLYVAAHVQGNAVDLAVSPGYFNMARGVGVTAAGDLEITATGAIAANGTLSGAGVRISTPTQLTLPQYGVLTSGGAATLSAGTMTIGGLIETAGNATLTSGGMIISATGSLLSGAGILLSAQSGSIGEDGQITAAGDFAAAAGADVSVGGNARISAASIAMQANQTVGIYGTLLASAITLSGDGAVTVGQQATVTARDSVEIAAPAGTIDVQGSVTAGAGVSMQAATTFSETATGHVSGGRVAIGGASISLGGAVAATATLDAAAGGSISQSSGGIMQAGTQLTLSAPGTISLAGALEAPRIQIGDSSTRDVVWDNTVFHTNSLLHGATQSISLASPLTSGPGVFVRTASFQQVGTSVVDPLSTRAATFELTISGEGTAHFASLQAPATQFLLDLTRGGKASGLIDVAGLNIFHAFNDTPFGAVNLTGAVNGTTGTAAAAKGFSHLLSNINYQINGCPVQSINCVLLSPVIVPVQDPVSDYAETTQHRRLSDDDALPNVAVEDY
jgi:filamentous hemagglutinin family protein